MQVRWVTAFLDLAPDVHAAGEAFWSAVTGYAVSARRGDESVGEFATLLPPTGEPHLKVQRLGDGPSRVHLDVHLDEVDDIAVDAAVRLGARVVHRSPHGFVVLSSPAGVTFCLVGHRPGVRAPAARWGRHTSIVDQVCLDVPAARAAAEADFWSALTGWTPAGATSAAEFRPLTRPTDQPLRLMVQAVGDDRAPATAHLDLATDDRVAEVARHVALGATVTSRTDRFTVLTDPAGLPYCVTDRDPVTGLLP